MYRACRHRRSGCGGAAPAASDCYYGRCNGWTLEMIGETEGRDGRRMGGQPGQGRGGEGKRDEGRKRGKQMSRSRSGSSYWSAQEMRRDRSLARSLVGPARSTLLQAATIAWLLAPCTRRRGAVSQSLTHNSNNYCNE